MHRAIAAALPREVPAKTFLSTLAAKMRALRHGRETRDVLWLYAAHLSGYILPLLTVTYVARVMGPGNWGLLAIFHSFGLYASQIVEYGFNLSATRDIARQRDDAGARASILASVHSAKIILSVLMVLCAAAAYPFLPVFYNNPRLFFCGAIYALGQGSTLLWYFQGMGRISELAIIDVGSRALASAATMAIIRKPEDGWWMIALNAAACLATTAFGLTRVRRDTPLGFAPLGRGIETLRNGFPLFVFRAAVSLYTAANGFLLGLFAPIQSVGYYMGAERAYKGLTAFLHPLMQFLYARVNHAMGRDKEADKAESTRVARSSFLMMIASGAVLGLVCLAGAPLFIRILLGPGFEPAVPVLRMFALVLMLDAIGIALGVQWMLPLGLDKQFTAIIVVAGITNVILAPLLARPYGHAGMALAVIASETVVAAGCFIYLRLRKLDPFSLERLPDNAKMEASQL